MQCLTIDHKADDGNEFRKQFGGRSGDRLYNWIVQNDFPTGFQTLCANHNLKKHIQKTIAARKNDGSAPSPDTVRKSVSLDKSRR